METHELIQQAFRQKPAKHVAADLGRAVSHVRKWARPQSASGIPNPLDAAQGYLQSTRHLPSLQHLCAGMGGTFVPDPQLQNPPPPLNLAAQEAVDAMADCIKAAHAVSHHRGQDRAANEEYLAELQLMKAKCEALAQRVRHGLCLHLPLLWLVSQWFLTGEVPELVEQV